ncbi:MAG: peroxiredoxin [Rubellimicrobium sp.]|nr:peroxiredoxin [Rubellimicrobium sp.]
MPLSEGQEVPDFTLACDGGGTVALSSLRGAPVVVFAYPRAGTPTCTDEARQFSARLPEFTALGATVLGLSPDPVAALGRFRDRQDLSVALLSDPQHEVLSDWGIWTEKQMYGRRSMGVERTTVLIGADGRARRIWRKVRLAGHLDEVLAALAAP